MLTCAIPECLASEKTLRSGNVYLVDVIEESSGPEVPEARKKFVWLCASCVHTHAVQTWRPAGQQIRSKAAGPPISLDDLVGSTGLSAPVLALSGQ